ncbi:MAG: sulfurtransferase [Bowdeniella nasicola]|nr:sulfurtransferase [Bowdeniella nasicola]
MDAPFVSWHWCREHHDAIVFADVRWHLDRRGYQEYAEGHIPGAAFIDLDRELAGEGAPTDGRHPLPTPEAFARAMANAGIDGTKTVVAYDSIGGGAAARLVWLLRQIDINAAILDGGLSDVDVELETGWPHISPTTFPVRPWPKSAFANTSQTLQASQTREVVLIDARPRARFRGEVAGPDKRRGHIPSAQNLPIETHVTPTGHLLPQAALRERFAAAGVDGTRPVISYCGSGVTGCHNLLVMEYLGLPAGRLYPASFSGWAADERMPVETAQSAAS